ncbi:MAG: hypothetical protein IT350_12930 [Deltaproteobacteria bacterium]|nr:hypothetical protein [Deltaproteobacteria bacterium]
MTRRIGRISGVFAVAAALVLFGASAAYAGRISINSGAEFALEEDEAIARVWVQNDGDEAARDVQPTAEYFGRSSVGPKWATLAPKERQTHVFSLGDPPALPGSYPFVMTIDFADLNQYPLTATNVMAMQAGPSGGRPGIFAKADAVTLKKSGTMTVALKNEDNVDKAVRARVLGPRELAVVPREFDLALVANGQAQQQLAIDNFSALPGSTYPIFVVFEYDLSGFHYTFVSVTQAAVGAGGMSPGARRNVIALAGIAFAAVLALEIARRVRTAKKRRR